MKLNINKCLVFALRKCSFEKTLAAFSRINHQID